MVARAAAALLLVAIAVPMQGRARQEVASEGGGGGGHGPWSPAPVTATADGVWSWFGGARAVQSGDSTYLGWVTTQGDIMVGQINRATGASTSARLYYHLEVDDHTHPALLLHPDGRLSAFFTKHNSFPLMYRTTVNPGDITDWGPLQLYTGDVRFTYPYPVYLSAEQRYYLFWRDWDWGISYATSSDGVAWSAKQPFIRTPQNNPYLKIATNGVDTIALAFTDSHPEIYAMNSVYFAYYRNEAFVRTNGSPIKPVTDGPLTPAEADTVHDAAVTGRRGWIWDMTLDRLGWPVLAYATFPSATDHRYHYARWNGVGWTQRELVAAGGSIDESGDDPYYSGGIAIDRGNPSLVYLSRQVNGAFELERWATADSGATWIFDALTSGSPEKNIRPVVPEGHWPGNVSVLWLRGPYISFLQYATRIVFLNGNQAPLVSAGADQTISSPSQTVSLAGAVVDDGYPTSRLTTWWTQMSGPADARFANRFAPGTSVTLPREGVYVLRLIADDGQDFTFQDVALTRAQSSARQLPTPLPPIILDE